MPGITYSVGLDAKEFISGMNAVVTSTRAGKESVAEAARVIAGGGREMGEAMVKLKREAPEAAAAVDKLQAAVKQHAKAQGDAATNTRNTGQAMLTTGRAVQDLQFGIAGVLNNIEALVMALGGGAGLAGVLTLVGVALSLLLPMLKGSGEEAEKAAAKHKELAKQADDLASALRKDAASFRESDAAAARYRKTLSEIETASDKATAALNRRQKLLEAGKQAELAVIDARAEAQTAEVDDAKSRGAIDDKEAERRKTAIAEEKTAARAKVEDEIESGRQQTARQQAETADEKASRLANLADREKRAASGLLSSKDRELAEAEKASAEAGLSVSADKAASIQRGLKAQDETDAAAVRSYGFVPDQNKADRERLLKDQERVDTERREAASRLRETSQRLDADKAARERTGYSSREEFESSDTQRRGSIEAERGKAADLRAEMEAAALRRKGSSTAGAIKQGAEKTRAETRLREIDQRDERERQSKEREQLESKWDAEEKAKPDAAEPAQGIRGGGAAAPAGFNFGSDRGRPGRISSRPGSMNTRQFRAMHGDGGMRSQAQGLYGRPYQAPDASSLDRATGRGENRQTRQGNEAAGQRRIEGGDQREAARDALFKRMLKTVEAIERNQKKTT